MIKGTQLESQIIIQISTNKQKQHRLASTGKDHTLSQQKSLLAIQCLLHLSYVASLTIL